MGKLKYLGLGVLFCALLAPLGLVQAQTYDSYDYSDYYDYDYDWDDYEYEYELTDGEAAAALALGSTMMFLFVGIATLPIYIFMSITQFQLAKRLGHEKAWMAWVPIANSIQLFQMAGMSPWLVLVMLVPIANIVVMFLAMANVADRVNYNKALVLLNLVPFGSFVFMGLLAWGNKDKEVKPLTA